MSKNGCVIIPTRLRSLVVSVFLKFTHPADMNIKPITPKEFQESYGSGVNEIVIEVVNELLIKSASYEGEKRVELTQPKVVDALVAKGIKREDIFNKGMLDFEPAFREVGWKVTWNKGAYFEPDSASHWVFECN